MSFIVKLLLCVLKGDRHIRLVRFVKPIGHENAEQLESRNPSAKVPESRSPLVEDRNTRKRERKGEGDYSLARYRLPLRRESLIFNTLFLILDLKPAIRAFAVFPG